MCHTIRKQHFDRNNLRGQMATLTEEKIALIENVAKDVIATVDIEKVRYYNPGFKRLNN